MKYITLSENQLRALFDIHNRNLVIEAQRGAYLPMSYQQLAAKLEKAIITTPLPNELETLIKYAKNES